MAVSDVQVLNLADGAVRVQIGDRMLVLSISEAAELKTLLPGGDD